MNAIHVLFETDQFNVSVVHDHFVNPCCFGEDLAAWLQSKLADRGIQAGKQGQEDWGWYLQVEFQKNSYFLGMSGNAGEPETGSNQGEWRIIVELKRSLYDRIKGRNKIGEDDPMLRVIGDILAKEPDFKNIHRETYEQSLAKYSQ